MNDLFKKKYPEFEVFDSSIRKQGEKYYFVARRKGKYYLVTGNHTFNFIEKEAAAKIIRDVFPFFNPVCSGLKNSFGFGDRTGFATPGHIMAVKKSSFFPIFAQQSARELERMSRSFQQVIDDAIFWCFTFGWSGPFGADADHAKSFNVLEEAINAGFSFFTIDPSDKIGKIEESEENKDQLVTYLKEYSGKKFSFDGFEILFTDEVVGNLAIIFGKAIDFVQDCYLFIRDKKKNFDFEVSIDETKLPTTPVAHVFIVLELIRRKINFQSLALRLPGKFEKGIDYKGDIKQFAQEIEIHNSIRRKLGPYKISLHSGSDKFSIYKIFREIFGDMIHVKTSGTSWIQAMKTIAVLDRDLFVRCIEIGLRDFRENSASYEISADVSNVCLEKVRNENIVELFANNNIRQLIHISYGSIIGNKDPELKDAVYLALGRNLELYTQFVEQHISKHLKLLS
ncbi:MAG: tagaturonate epimerase family protein [Candidatus Omnitrophica bacterium]|nr:tagaturonate epimerase family protein [Candidatus Omnitrophota bacterium]